MKTCTIIRDIDRWFVCIITMTTTMKNTNIKIKNKNDSVIGVDVGLTNWITLSDGQVIDRPKFLETINYKKIKTLAKKLIKERRRVPIRIETRLESNLQNYGER